MVGNIYLQCSADRDSRNSREEYGSRYLPELLLERRQNIVIGGDWNLIILQSDCTHYPDQKISPSMAMMVSTFSLLDSFKTMCPADTTTKSHYYDSPLPGETHIDQAYHKRLTFSNFMYVSIGGLSDHCSLICSYKLPQVCQKVLMP